MYIKISVRARTGGKYSAPTILIDSFVIQAISIFPLKTWVYKNQRSARTGGKYSAPTTNKKRPFFLHNINNIPQSEISHVLSKMDTLTPTASYEL